MQKCERLASKASEFRQRSQIMQTQLAYTTRKRVKRLPCKELHLNPAMPEGPMEGYQRAARRIRISINVLNQ